MNHVTVSNGRPQGLAVVWWAACALWAYFVFGELVVSAGCPEVLALLGLLAGVAAAGRRASSHFRSAGAVALGGLSAIATGAAFGLLVPALFGLIVPERNVALFGLLTSASTALVTLRAVRRRERAEQELAAKPALPRVLAWVLTWALTTIAVLLAAQE